MLVVLCDWLSGGSSRAMKRTHCKSNPGHGRFGRFTWWCFSVQCTTAAAAAATKVARAPATKKGFQSGRLQQSLIKQDGSGWDRVAGRPGKADKFCGAWRRRRDSITTSYHVWPTEPAEINEDVMISSQKASADFEKIWYRVRNHFAKNRDGLHTWNRAGLDSNIDIKQQQQQQYAFSLIAREKTVAFIARNFLPFRRKTKEVWRTFRKLNKFEKLQFGSRCQDNLF